MITTLLLITATVTGYAPVAGGINCDGDCSITAYGYRPGPTVAACGWGWPAGQELTIPDYGMVRCWDRFGTAAGCEAAGIGLYDVDAWFASRAEAFAWGRRRLRIGYND